MSRSQSLTLSDTLTAIVLFTLLLLGLVLNGTSQSYTRGGDDDEGSGIGGTGRYPGAIPSTGPLKPFLGLNERQDEVIILELPQPSLVPPAPIDGAPTDALSALPIRPLPTPLNLQPVLPLQKDSIDIATAVARTLTLEAWYFQMPVAPEADWQLAAPENSTALSLAGLKQMLSDMQQEGDGSTGNAVDSATPRPEQLSPRFRRPDLPPVQRVRPVERVTVVPPRIQPMRI